MLEIIKIEDRNEKSIIAEEVLENSEKFFQPIKTKYEYIEEVKDLDFFAAFEGEEVLGFISSKYSSFDCGEIHTFGVKKEYKGKEIDRLLYENLENYLKTKVDFIQIKTIAEGISERADRIISFYRSLGFKDLEVIPEIWGHRNPCLIMIKKISEKKPIEKKKKKVPIGKVIAVILAILIINPYFSIFQIMDYISEKKMEEYISENTVEKKEPIKNLEKISIYELVGLLGDSGYMMEVPDENLFYLFIKKDEKKIREFEKYVDDKGLFLELIDVDESYPITINYDVDFQNVEEDIVNILGRFETSEALKEKLKKELNADIEEIYIVKINKLKEVRELDYL